MTAASMLAAARRDLGLSGRPNWITRAYAQKNGAYYRTAPWCDQAVTEWARKSGNAAAVLPAGDRAYTVYHAQDGQRLGLWHAGTVANILRYARPAALVLFDWEGTDNAGAVDHIGVIERVLPDGRVQTIEGNTGNAVKRRVRSASVIAGFWNPPYGKQEKDMPLTSADAKLVAKAVIASLTHKVTKDMWAGQQGIFEVGQELDPKAGLRQTWAYTKDSNARIRKLEKTAAAQGATIDALVKALAAQSTALNADQLIARIRDEIASVTIHLDAGPDDDQDDTSA